SGSVGTPLWPDEYFNVIPVESNFAIAQYHFKLMIPESIDIFSYNLATSLEPEITSENGWKTFRIHLYDPEPAPLEDFVTPDTPQFGTVLFTTMQSWTEVVEWATPLMSFQETLPSSFLEKLDEIA